jgi:hypothetical protein
MSESAAPSARLAADWSEGYVTEIDYTPGYYPELNPLRVRLALLGAGLACREIRSACELGYGQGLSVNVHAAAGGVSWAGTDFNPVHAAGAQALASAVDTRGDSVGAAILAIVGFLIAAAIPIGMFIFYA